VDLDDGIVCFDGPGDGFCAFVMLALSFLFWPANLVSGDATRRVVEGVFTGEIAGEIVENGARATGEDLFSLSRISLRFVLEPTPATCQGDDAFSLPLLTGVCTAC